jgi:hypothetical protein
MRSVLSLLLAILLLVDPSSSASAQTLEEQKLEAFLQKKYTKGGGLFSALDKVLPEKPLNAASDYEGRKPDGSYWWGAYFNAMNVSVVGHPRRALEKFCTGANGSFALSYAVRVFDNGEGAQNLKLTDPTGGPDFSINAAMLERWRYFGPVGEQLTGGPSSWSGSSPAAFIDDRKLLGLFSCKGSDAKPLWHVAIMPTRFGNIEALQAVGQTQNSWFMLSIRAVTVQSINATLAEFKAEEKKQAAQAAELNDQWSKEQAAREAAYAKRAPLLAEFRKNLAVGTITNCGRVLAFNGPLVEVQVPSHIKLGNGATRVFVERATVEPDDRDALACKWD